MELSKKPIEVFENSINVLTDCSHSLPPKIQSAAKTITDCLFNEKKILCCGNSSSGNVAEIFTNYMLNRYEVERPGLPIITLNSTPSVMTSIAIDFQFADIFAKQIRALGQEGDVMFIVTTSAESHNIIHAVDAAHDRNMTLIILSGCDGGQIADLLREQDIEIRVPSWDSKRITEAHILTVHCICDLIDHYLLGQ